MADEKPQAREEKKKQDEIVPDDGSSSEKEVGGRDGPDPTRYGDWEKNGRCVDF